jgi:hypothetical protein
MLVKMVSMEDPVAALTGILDHEMTTDELIRGIRGPAYDPEIEAQYDARRPGPFGHGYRPKGDYSDRCE